MKKVAILCYDGISLFELACATELFMLPRPEIPSWYVAQLVTLEAAQQGTSLGVGFFEARKVRSFKSFDMIVISSWPVAASDIPQSLARALRQAARRGARLLSFCSGAFLLARLGLLDGLKATTHWRYAEQFISEFKAVTYVDNVLYVYDGSVGTSAGSAAALDLGLAVIRDDYDSATANQVARRLVLPAQRSGGQAQFVETPIARRPQRLSQTLDWAILHLASINSVDEMAGHAYMSRRSFDRKFRNSLGVSPQVWLVDRRLDLARNLLENTTESMDLVARQVGFSGAEVLRHHFRNKLGLSPSKYRENFHARRRS